MKAIYIDKNGVISQTGGKNRFLYFKIRSDGYKVYGNRLLYENNNPETLIKALFNIIFHFKKIKESNYSIEVVKNILLLDNITLKSKRTVNYENIDERMLPRPENEKEFMDFFSFITKTYGIMELKNNYETANISFTKTLDLYRNYDYIFTNENGESLGINYYIDKNIKDICIEYSNKDGGISIDVRGESKESYTKSEIIYEFVTCDDDREVNRISLYIDLYKCEYSINIFSRHNYQDLTFEGSFNKDLKSLIDTDIETFIEILLNHGSKKSGEIGRRNEDGNFYEWEF